MDLKGWCGCLLKDLGQANGWMVGLLKYMAFAAVGGV